MKILSNKRLVLGVPTVYPKYGFVADPMAANGAGDFGPFINVPHNYMAATHVVNPQYD